MSARLIKSRPLEPLAHLIFGSIMEAALLVAHSDNPQRRSAEVGRALDDLLAGLKQSPLVPGWLRIFCQIF